MDEQKGNYLMLVIATAVAAIGGIVYMIHHVFGLFYIHRLLLGVTAWSGSMRAIFILLVMLTIALLISGWIIYIRNPLHSKLKLIITLILTHSSMLIIASGDGFVEYHFSIFMVLAFIAYFNSVSLILISTMIFAVHHLVGYFMYPELLCGTADYQFSLLMIHAVFLLLTSGANIILTLFNKGLQQKADKIQHEAEERSKISIAI